MLVPVSARPASPVVLVMDETVVALDLVLAAVFAAETGGGGCCVRSCCLGTPCLERSSVSSPPDGLGSLVGHLNRNVHT